MDTFVTAIKQYPGQVQVTRSVKVKVPGKHFPQLQPSEQAQEQAAMLTKHFGSPKAHGL